MDIKRQHVTKIYFNAIINNRMIRKLVGYQGTGVDTLSVNSY